MAERFVGEEAKPEVPAETEIAAMSFETALGELEAIVQKLERGQLDLEASISAYERGTALRRHCAAKLREVQLRVERITTDAAGNIDTQPFDAP